MDPMAKTQFLASCFNTPGPQAQALFYTVVRAGHLRAAPDYRIERRTCPGQDILFCLGGAGFIRREAEEFRVGLGELAWIDGRYPHAHRPDNLDPWELLWLRFDSHDLPQLCAMLSVQRAPVFRGLDQRKVKAIFRQILELMERRPLSMEALLHAEMASLLAQLFRARQNHPSATAESVAGGAEGPLPADAHQVDAARLIFRLQQRQHLLDVDVVGQLLGQRRLVERLAGGEQQRLQEAQRFGPRLRLTRLFDHGLCLRLVTVNDL